MTSSPQPPAQRVLVVDDSEGSRRLATRLLLAAGYSVDAVNDGPAGIEAARDATYGLVLMDLRMPGMDGASAAQSIRALASTEARIPIIATTTMPRATMDDRYPRADFDDHLRKPLRAETLLPVIERWLGESRTTSGEEAGVPALDRDVIARVHDDLGPEGFADVLDIFAEEIFAQLGQIPDALRHGALDIVELCAHRIRGGAATLGASALEQHAAALEQASREHDVERAEALSRSILPCAERVRQEVAVLRASR